MHRLDLTTADPRARGFLLDMDGVIYRGDRPITAASRFLSTLDARSIPWLLVTNRSCRTPAAISSALAGMGIAAPAQRILTSSEATAAWLAERGHRRVFAIGEDGLLEALASHGIAAVERGAEAVVVGLDRRVALPRLTLALRLLADGLPFVATNPDPTCPGADGEEPECGMLIAALTAGSGRQPVVIGKPEPALFAAACTRIGLPAAALTMIGDRLDTDVLGAQRAGIRSALVLTGHTDRALLAVSGIRPELVLEDLDAAQPATSMASDRRLDPR